jgi:hypothetical protein
MHSRSELSIHRWDLVGGDDISELLLSQPELTEHAVNALNALDRLQEYPTQRAERAGLAATEELSFALRVSGQPDVVLRWHQGRATLSLQDDSDFPGLETDAATRLLLLWGRCPDPEHRITTAPNSFISSKSGCSYEPLARADDGRASCQVAWPS